MADSLGHNIERKVKMAAALASIARSFIPAKAVPMNGAPSFEY